MTLPLTTKGRVLFEARPYQEVARERVEEAWANGVKGPMLVMATGTGKTKTALYVCSSIKGRIFWLAHREELLDTPLADLWFGTESAGIVQADRNSPDARIVFCSKDTLTNPARREALLRGGYPELIVVDEAHHSVSPGYRAVIEALMGPNTRLLGLTATADREDNLDLGDLWTVVYSFGIVEAIDQGFLVSPWAVVSRPPGFDEKAFVGRRDYEEAVGESLLAAGVVAHTVAMLRATHRATRLPQRDEARVFEAKGRSWLVFTQTIEQARLTAEALSADGWKARWVSGDTPKRDRKRLAQAFAKGEIDVLCNAGVFTEGTDLPKCSGVLLARALQSWSLFVQCLGRGLRIFDAKWLRSWGLMNRLDERYRGDQDCLVIDLAGATDMHSLVAAPALLGGVRCPHPSGHELEPRPDGKGGCKHCDHEISCWASWSAGGDGSHKWNDGGQPPRDVDAASRACVHCGKPQCHGSPDGRHLWLAQPGWTYQCIQKDCKAKRPMPLASLQGERRSPTEPAPAAAWVSLLQLEGHVEALDLGAEHGLLYLVGGPVVAQPWWVPPRVRTARPLTDAPVDRWYAEELCADLVRKAKKAWDPWRRETLFGGVEGSVDDVVEMRQRATARAVATGVSRWR